MFSYVTNLLCSHNKVKYFFGKADNELKRISQWVKANKLSLSEGKTKFTLFHRPYIRHNLPLQLPNLKINEYQRNRSSLIKFLGVFG